MIIDFFTSILFYLTPYLAGRLFTKKIVQAYLLGIILLFVIFFASKEISLLFNVDFSITVRYLIYIVSIVSVLDFLFKKTRIVFNFDLQSLKPILIVLAISSSIYFLIWKVSIPYPLQLNWDIYEHITLANQIQKGIVSIFPTNISDTFTLNTYSPMFAILLSVPKIITGRNLLGIYWWLEYWHFLFAALAAFLLAKKILNNNLLAILAGILSSLTFESLMAYTTLFLIPQTLAVLISVFVIIGIDKYSLKSLTLAALVVFLIHYVVGFLCVLALFFVFLSKRFNISQKVINFGIIFSLLFLFAVILFNLLGRWNILSSEEAGHFNFTLKEKIDLLFHWYGIFAFVFVPLGIFKLVRNGDRDQRLFLILALLVLAVSLAPFSYFLKFYALAHYLVNILLTVGLGVIIYSFPRAVRAVSIIVVILIFASVFYTNQLIFKDPLVFKNLNTNTSYEEIKTASFLSSYASKHNLFIIGDPGLSYILEAESGVNSPGGAYMSLKNRMLLPNITANTSTSDIKKSLLEVRSRLVDLKGKEELFIVGGRYFAWQNLPADQKESIFYNIWVPTVVKREDKYLIDVMKKSIDFKVLYENDQLVVLKIN